MKTLFPFFLLLCSLSINAQSDFSRWSLDAYYTPQYVNFPNIENSFIITPTLYPIATYSYTAGFAVERRLSNRWSINAGLAFQNAQETFGYSLLRWGNQHDGNGAYDPSIRPEKFTERLRDKYHHLQIPLSTKFYLNSAPARFYLRTGIQVDWVLGTKRDYWEMYEKLPIGRTQETYERINNVNASALFGMGMEIDVQKRITLFVEPEISTAVLELYSPSFKKDKSYSLGMRVGLKLNLSK